VETVAHPFARCIRFAESYCIIGKGYEPRRAGAAGRDAARCERLAASDPDGLQGLDFSLSVVDELGFIEMESWDSLLLASGKRPTSLCVSVFAETPGEPAGVERFALQVAPGGLVATP